MPNLIIGSTMISYSIRRSLRAKYVSLSVSEDGVQIVAPVSMKDNEIIPLVEKKQAWILKKLEVYRQQHIPMRTKHEFVNGEKFLFMGKSYPLWVLEYEGLYSRVKLTEDQFLVSINRDMPPEKRNEAVRRKLEQWYISKAKELIRERLEFFIDKLGVKVNTVRLRNQKTRWGSCSQKGNLNFNWKLIMAPMPIVDYVVVHELCHLRQMNHSKEFWQLVGTQIPDYQQRRNWLKQNGVQLNL